MDARNEETDNEQGVPAWSHPDNVTLPQFLSLVRAFLDMLLLASGYQPTTAFPARWTPYQLKRALGWASLIEEIIKRIPMSDEGKRSKKALEMAFQDVLADTIFLQGPLKLSCSALSKAKNLFIFAMSNALGCNNGHVESLLSATYSDQHDWDATLQYLSDRITASTCTKSLLQAVQLASPVPSMKSSCGINDHCCQQWRQNSLSYMLNKKTMYKLSGADVLFKSSKTHWRAVFQAITNCADEKVIEIAELCCLHLSSNKWQLLLSFLLRPCQSPFCSRQSLNLWLLEHQKMQELEGNEVTQFMLECLGKELAILWKLPPMILAVAAVKGSPLFNNYVEDIVRHVEPERCSGRGDDSTSNIPDNIYERIWCLQLAASIN